MINCAIYPRKSKANDNSQSMEQQISDCRKYIDEHYPGSSITVYDGDYALTGHSTKKRKDFQRMMEAVRSGQIQMVVIMRYDRIARNMRDFCNLYHDMEEAGCNLVSVSQQIDTSTPYGKNFMYQMAAMAELEWAIISERYKDTAKYKREHGFAYTGRVPWGYMLQKTADGHKIVVKNPEKDAMKVFDYYIEHRNKMKTVDYVQQNLDSNFTYDTFRCMLRSDMYFGKVKGNSAFCEPYLTESEMEAIRSIKIIKNVGPQKTYILSRLVECPICKGNMYGQFTGNPHRKKYYSCGYVRKQLIHDRISIREDKIEDMLLTHLETFLDSKIQSISISSSAKKTDHTKQINALEKQKERLNYMFEKGRISVEQYEQKFEALDSQIKSLEPEQPKDYSALKNTISLGWKDMYKSLNEENKQIFWHSIIEKINISEDKEIVDIIFK